MSFLTRPAAAVATEFPTEGRPVLIAIVDDDEAILRALQRLLRGAGLTARTFTSGEQLMERLDALPRFAPDCVILDLYLTGASGLEIHERLARRGGRIPVILMTGYDQALVRARAPGAGAVAFLRKPFRSNLLFAALATAIGPSRS
jgi:FixJ family two-component response regulator